jgi:hypothetical protein
MSTVLLFLFPAPFSRVQTPVDLLETLLDPSLEVALSSLHFFHCDSVPVHHARDYTSDKKF